MTTRPCHHCGGPVTSRLAFVVYCAAACAAAHRRARTLACERRQAAPRPARRILDPNRTGGIHGSARTGGSTADGSTADGSTRTPAPVRGFWIRRPYVAPLGVPCDALSPAVRARLTAGVA